MFDNWTIEAALGVLRHILTTLGGGLIAQGLVTTSQWSDAAGAIVTLAGVGWSIYQKKQQHAAVRAALYTPVPTKGHP